MRSGHTHRPREPGAGEDALRIIGNWALETEYSRFVVGLSRELMKRLVDHV